MRQLYIPGLVGVAALLAIAMLTLSGWSLPPVETKQQGYRGTGMMLVEDADRVEAKMAANMVPEEVYPLETSADEPKAGEVYENVQVLGDLPDSQFTRLMAQMTEWVSPEEGCGYCHNLENLADDSLYTKVVARRMLQMTQHINVDWTDHVAATGVTCYTCHRGNPVPQEVWFNNPGPRKPANAGYRGEGQNLAAVNVGLTSLNYDPFTPLLEDAQQIRVHTSTALPSGNDSSIQTTERTYSLMIHMSEALGENCTFCHNSRAFNDWSQSSPQRVRAWHGIQMVRDLNNDYLTPLTSVFPAHRLGSEGDAPKLNCATCHNGVNKPLYGAQMLDKFPSLRSGN
jgi:photosynthetic reaction center cytochrome c subunit